MAAWLRALPFVAPVLVAVGLVDQTAPAPPMPEPLGYVCFRTEAAPKIDGKLDDDAWKAAPWSDDFVDIEGDSRPRPAHRTRVKMLWDAKGLYIAAEITEPHVWGTLTKHDAVIFNDNDFEVFLDPDGDNHLYGELELNALNTTWDLLLTKPYKDGGRALNAWEITGLKTAVHVNGTLNDPRDTDTGWTVEIFWPWEGLTELTGAKLPPKDGDKHRINFSRVEWDTEVVEGKYRKLPGRPEHNWVWSPQGVIDMHRPERWGYLQYTTKTSGPVSFVPDPDAAAKSVLYEVYYAQRGYRRAFGKYAKTLDELGLKESVIGAPRIETTRHGFEVTMPASKSGSGKKWSIAQDSRVWSD